MKIKGRIKKFSATLKTMPFADYKNFQDCVNKNLDKGNPQAYCGKIKHQIEGGEMENKKSSMKQKRVRRYA